MKTGSEGARERERERDREREREGGRGERERERRPVRANVKEQRKNNVPCWC